MNWIVAIMKASSKILLRCILLVFLPFFSLAAPNVAKRIPPGFSESPQIEEFLHVRVFEEPLVPIGSVPTTQENKELAQALRLFKVRSDLEDFSSVMRFLEAHTQSPWRPSLLLNLGLEYYNAGYFSKALAAWEESWGTAKSATEPKARALADRALGELMKMNARIGRFERLEELLDESKGREVLGSATEKIDGAKQGLWTMLNRPEVAFRCGPLALDRIRFSLNPNDVGNPLIQNARSTQKGFSLAQVCQLSRDLAMDYQMAFRKEGGGFVTPAVVHWKVGHYAALIREEAGRYLVQDPTFGNSIWISPAALRHEASGYFLLPPGSLPSGWRTVPEAEGEEVWGKGTTSSSNPNNTTPGDEEAKPDENSCGMPVYNFHLMLVSLNIKDTPVGYTPPVGPPIYFTLTYNQREANQPANFSYSNFGPKWTFNWLGYITDNPGVTNADVTYYVEGGGTETYTEFDAGTQTFATQWRNQTVLERTSSDSYEMRFPDGSKKIFDEPDGSSGSARKVFLTQIMDSAGNTVTLTYDANRRLTTITDAIGQETTISYQLGGIGADIYKITKVTDPFGRYASFQYDIINKFVGVTDVQGLSSTFTYAGGDFVGKLTTPYGDTTFASVSIGRTRILESTDPQGDKERVEYNEYANIGIPYSEPGPLVPTNMFTRNSIMNARNTFYWDKKAMRDAPRDYSKAKIYHWIHTEDYVSANGVLESVKEPFENRVWFNYPGQPADSEGATLPGTVDIPSRIGRVMEDGSTQLVQLDRNSLGYVTNSVDPIGRRFAYIYDSNEIDLLEVRQTRGTNNELIAKFTYNSQHLPLTALDASGRTNKFIYNARGQLATNINARGETTIFSYDGNGYLLTIDGPLSGSGDSTTFTYDSYGRVRTVTDSEGYTITTDYDALDRPTTNSFPDSTYEVITYNRLDPETTQDRAGRVSRFAYNSLRQLVQVEEGTNWVTRFKWCRCGELQGITDPLGRTTSWHHDAQGRLTSKHFADGSEIRYEYEPGSGRLSAITDEQGQTKNFQYFGDDNLKQISYSNAIISTPSVNFTYDTNYDRVLTMEDGTGTTTYSYNPITGTPTLGAGQLASVDGPLSNDTITYQYDELGRVTNRAINSVAMITQYDAMGRLTNVNHSLGTFNYAYTNATLRLASIVYPNGQKTYFDYYGNSGDQRLKEIKNLTPSATTLSKFDYIYDPTGPITNWTQQAGTGTPQVFSLGYNGIDELTSAVVRTNGTTEKSFTYAYDLVGNRLSEQIDATIRTANFNPLNEIINQDAGSSPGFSGAKGYEWDAEYRLVGITNANIRTEFTYDGLDRLVRIIEKTNGIAGSEKRFVWCDEERCEERNSPPFLSP
jgi:YD repeat-containing protein